MPRNNSRTLKHVRQQRKIRKTIQKLRINAINTSALYLAMVSDKHVTAERNFERAIIERRKLRPQERLEEFDTRRLHSIFGQHSGFYLMKIERKQNKLIPHIASMDVIASAFDHVVLLLEDRELDGELP